MLRVDYDELQKELRYPLSLIDHQWWAFKSDYADCVLFFKIGIFYNLYHMDADLGVTELGLNYWPGVVACASFPETSLGKNMSILVNLNYKVARIEETLKREEITEVEGEPYGELWVIEIGGSIFHLTVIDCKQFSKPR